jgi:hypothetical protein
LLSFWLKNIFLLWDGFSYVGNFNPAVKPHF